MDTQLSLDYRFPVNTPQDLHHVQVLSEMMENSHNPVKVGCTTGEAPFSARLQVAEYNGIGLMEFQLNTQTGSNPHLYFERASSHIARNLSFAYNLVIASGGEVEVNTCHRTHTIRTGDTTIMNTDTPLSANMVKRSGVCNLALPASWDRIGDTRLEKAFGTLYSGSEHRNSHGLFRYVRHLLNRPDALTLPDATDKLYDIIALMLNPRATSQHRSGLLAMIQSHIESYYTSTDLSPAKVAAAFNISVRYLHQLFANGETTFTEYVTRLRLEHARQMLSDPLYQQRTILGIAYDCGFRDINHFGRRFKLHFDHTPGEYRRAQYHAQ